MFCTCSNSTLVYFPLHTDLNLYLVTAFIIVTLLRSKLNQCLGFRNPQTLVVSSLRSDAKGSQVSKSHGLAIKLDTGHVRLYCSNLCAGLERYFGGK